MKNGLAPLFDKIMLRKRAIVESVMDQLYRCRSTRRSAKTAVRWGDAGSAHFPRLGRRAVDRPSLLRLSLSERVPELHRALETRDKHADRLGGEV